MFTINVNLASYLPSFKILARVTFRVTIRTKYKRKYTIYQDDQQDLNSTETPSILFDRSILTRNQLAHVSLYAVSNYVHDIKFCTNLQYWIIIFIRTR